MCSGGSESLFSCGIVKMGGYLCNGDSVRCSMVIVGGYVCSEVFNYYQSSASETQSGDD